MGNIYEFTADEALEYFNRISSLSFSYRTGDKSVLKSSSLFCMKSIILTGIVQCDNQSLVLETLKSTDLTLRLLVESPNISQYLEKNMGKSVKLLGKFLYRDGENIRNPKVKHSYDDNSRIFSVTEILYN